MSYTGEIEPGILVLHGRARLLRKLRNMQAQRLRVACEQLANEALRVIRGLDANQHITPLDENKARLALDAIRAAQNEIAAIDDETGTVNTEISNR